MEVLNQMDMILLENAELRERLMRSMTFIIQPTDTTSNSGQSELLQMLIESAKMNANKKPNGWRFKDVMKQLGLVLYSLGNLQVYEFLAENFCGAIPTISTVRLQIYNEDVIVEGRFRIKELKVFLSERKFPLLVQCCEDATVVVKRIQYHAPSNQIIGCVLPFDENGIPIPEAYPATSAKVISDYFNNNEVSQYLYCIMAQPIALNAPPFCIAMFGTNNKFTAAQVHTRWIWTVQALQQEGIKLFGFSSDGDGRLLKTMRHNTILSSPNTGWQWFQAALKPPFLSIQDHIHLGLKLKSRLLKPSIILPLGPFKTVSRGHLVELITQTKTRDQHLLCLSDINPKDKMNFKALQRMSDPKVSSLLKSEIQDSDGTATYLEMMNQVVESYTRLDLTPCQRIEMLWEWVFFTRMWRSWVLATNGYTLQNNFITHNSYYCLELNAHALIQSIIWLRDEEQHSLFLPWLLSSQPCESTFRKLRAPHATGSGVVCFTVLEAKNFFRRMDLFAATQVNLESLLKFPRHQKRMKVSKASPHVPVCLPENFEIEAIIKKAFENAVSRALAFNLIKTRPKTIPPATLQYVSKVDMDLLETSDEEDDACDTENVDDPDSDNELPSEDEPEDNELNDVMEDLLIVSSGSIHLKTFQVPNLTESSPFVQVSDCHGNPAIIKKSSLCWLLRSEDSKISSDRLQRVQAESPVSSLPRNVMAPSREETVSVGNWCAFKFEDGSVGVGRILAFSYLTGTSVSDQAYSKVDAPTQAPSKNARGLGCLCTWFTIQKNQLIVTRMDLHGYYNIENYICTIPRPKIEGNKVLLNCTLTQIKKYLQK